ncbi:hypothetical protein [Listeria newyorkensis]|uniref:hypothetical protein n=1 Tax=Listeria newyorkensis TaxID=1497681 RepID=UPI00051CEA92|nr:hypothetical protein [Listeria newyorkensis]KGL45675.1 hypothetical protein EP58_03000 [Listeria newyorkensis]SQC55164.1 Uncharacterised protein [Listeria newyorkensis]SQC55397.1 Uncharacterised protein [Listeria newyorkensis]
MDQHVKITNEEWAKIKQVAETGKSLAGENKKRLDKHNERLDAIEDWKIALPIDIEEAVRNGLAPLLDKVMTYEKKFMEIEITKERERADRAEQLVIEEKGRKQFIRRTIIASAITSVVGGGLGIIITAFMANLLN